MPDRHGKLSVDEINEIAGAINSKAKDPSDPCPNCGQLSSNVVQYTSRLDVGHTVNGPGVNIPTQIVPTVATVCMNCGFVRQFAMDQLNLSFRHQSDSRAAASSTSGEALSDG